MKRIRQFSIVCLKGGFMGKTERKHRKLIGQLTLEEKAALLGGKGEWDSRDIPRLGIPSMIMSDALTDSEGRGGRPSRA